MRPLIADGGELTVLRSLAAYSYGQWSVEWPDSVPEEQRPELPDEREFGYVARLDVEPGRMGRRFVRADVSITAAEYTPEGKVIPYSGFSDVEQVIDEAASRTTGDVFFEREIERAGLNGSVPYVDFDVDDLVPVTLWGKSTIVPVTSIQEVTEAGEAVGWRVRVGGDLIADDVARERANRDIEAAIAQERRERTKDVATVSAVASSAQSTANTARSEVQAVRGTLAGEQAQEPDLVSQLVAVNDELQRLGQDPQPSLMLAFVSLSTALWETQQKWNRERETIDSRQDAFDADLQEQLRAIISLLHLNNHGAWTLSKKYTLKAGTWTELYFGKPKGDVAGCEQGDLSNSEGSFVRFLEAGQWEVSARFYVPGRKLVAIGGETDLGLVLMRSGQRVDYAESTGYDNGWYYTLSIRTVFNVQKNDYVYVRARSESDRGDGPLSQANTNDAYSELIVRQLSRG